MTRRITYEVELFRISGVARVRVEVDEGTDHEEVVKAAVAKASEPEVVAAFDRHVARHGLAVQERSLRVVTPGT